MVALRERIGRWIMGEPVEVEPNDEQHALPASPMNSHTYGRNAWTGEKYDGGMPGHPAYAGVPWTDYVALRNASEDVFKRNLYGRGVIRRLVTNEIHTGLKLDAKPLESLLGRPEGSLFDWSMDVEQRFTLWGEAARYCHHSGQLTFGQLQTLIRIESLVGGDCLVVLRQHAETKLPTVEVIAASEIGSAGTTTHPAGHTVDFGVERDATGTHVAYHVRSNVGLEYKTIRIPAFDSSGRRTAWMVYGTEVRTHTVRGEPLLGVVLQSLNEIDRYRDSVQRKAVLNSILAMFIRKDQTTAGTLPFSNAKARSGTQSPWVNDGADNLQGREFRAAQFNPGIIIEELAPGEVPVGMDSKGIDLAFPEFERAVIAAVAWGMQVPPEILMLSFNSNYSASQAALNEFKIYLDLVRVSMGRQFLQYIYADWLLSAALIGMVDAPSLITAANDATRFDVVGAWANADWSGAIKPTTDPVKQINAYIAAINEGLMTHDLATKQLTGRRFENNIKQLAREWEMLAEARKPIEPEPPAAFGGDGGDDGGGEDDDDNDDENDENNNDEEQRRVLAAT